MTSPARSQELQLAADYESLRALGAWLEGLVPSSCAEDSLLPRLELAVHEVCANVVDHAYRSAAGVIDLAGIATEDKIVVTVRDSGAPFDAALVRRPAPDAPQVRGYGLMIIEQLVDDIAYERRDEANLWTLSVNLTAP
jgi:serine/threonine-protein kinase RsbW